MEGRDRGGDAGARPGWADAAPPYGAYRGSYGTFDEGRCPALGGGPLGGWSYATQGGFFDVEPPRSELLPVAAAREPARSWEELVAQELAPAA